MNVSTFRNHKDKDGSFFNFRFRGTVEGDTHYDVDHVVLPTEELLDKFINQNMYHNSMSTNVKFLRTILKNYDENELILIYENNNFKETVEYKDSHLISFEMIDKYNDSELGVNFTIKYTSDLDTGITLKIIGDNIIEELNIKKVSDRINNFMRELNTLNDVKPIELNRDSKIIIEVYKLFYNQDPDFSDKNIDIKIQTMLSILSAFGVSISDYSFSLCGSKNITMSINLSNLIYELFPIGKITNIDNPIELNKEAKDIIVIVGEEIKNAIENENNKEEALINISKIIHATRYNLSSSASIEEIGKYTDCSNNKVESSMKLVKSINEKIKNEDDCLKQSVNIGTIGYVDQGLVDTGIIKEEQPKQIIDLKSLLLSIMNVTDKRHVDKDIYYSVLEKILSSPKLTRNYEILCTDSFCNEEFVRGVLHNNDIFKLDIDEDYVYLRNNSTANKAFSQCNVDLNIREIIEDSIHLTNKEDQSKKLVKKPKKDNKGNN